MMQSSPPCVLEEVAHGDPDATQRRLQSIVSFPMVEVVPEVYTLAAAYFAAIPLPDKAQADAYHLALNAWHGLDYLVSWNCTHLVSGRVRMIIEEVNAQFGIRNRSSAPPKNLWRWPNG
jgi:hypothetical protein